MFKSPRFGRIICVGWVGGVLAATMAPSPQSRWFDGLPWTTAPELLLAAFGIAVLGAASAQRRLATWVGQQRRALQIVLVSVPLLVLALKLVAVQAGNPAGFAACYNGLVESGKGEPRRACERAFDAPFGPDHLTRYDAVMDFEPELWQLGFVNSNRFNFYMPGDIDRRRLPFRATWNGSVEIGEGESVEVFYVGESSVTIGSISTSLEPSSGGRIERIAVPPGRHRFSASYRFDDGSRVGRRMRGSPPELDIAVIGPDGVRRPLAPARTLGDRLVAGALDIACAVAILILVIAASPLARWCLLLAFTIVSAANTFQAGGLLPWPAFIALSTVAILGLVASFARRLAFILPAAMTIAGLYAIARLGGEAMIVRTGGDDWLTYESFAREILETWSLRGGEAVFYFQPFYRYGRFILRLFLGDGDFLVYTAMNTLLFGGALLLLAQTASHVRWPQRSMVAVAAAALLAMVASSPAQRGVVLGLSEPLSWICMLWGATLLFAREEFGAHAAGTVLAGFNGITRLNHLPAVVLTFAAFLLRLRRFLTVRSAVLIGLLLLVLVLPVLHNAAYGQRVVLISDRANSVNQIVTPAQLVRMPSDPDVRAKVADQVWMMFDVDNGFTFAPFVFGMRVAEVLWIASLLLAVWRRSAYAWAVALLPAAYLGVHLLYQIDVYYPRFIVAGHLAMAISFCLMLLPAAAKHEPSTSG